MKNSVQNLQYVGSFSTLQKHGNAQYMGQMSKKYTVKQNELYSRLLNGLKTFTPEEIYSMNSNKKKRIHKAHTRAQQALNIWKQEITIKETNSLFNALFPNSKLTKQLINDSETTNNFKNTLSFKDLGINKNDIIRKFMEIGLLPTNFATL
tara:strand:+ start:847 stop:1299 length:453 start_codon:yes stop_codon:yes gene_type:complete